MSHKRRHDEETSDCVGRNDLGYRRSDKRRHDEETSGCVVRDDVGYRRSDKRRHDEETSDCAGRNDVGYRRSDKRRHDEETSDCVVRDDVGYRRSDKRRDDKETSDCVVRNDVGYRRSDKRRDDKETSDCVGRDDIGYRRSDKRRQDRETSDCLGRDDAGYRRSDRRQQDRETSDCLGKDDVGYRRADKRRQDRKTDCLGRNDVGYRRSDKIRQDRETSGCLGRDDVGYRRSDNRRQDRETSGCLGRDDVGYRRSDKRRQNRETSDCVGSDDVGYTKSDKRRQDRETSDCMESDEVIYTRGDTSIQIGDNSTAIYHIQNTFIIDRDALSIQTEKGTGKAQTSDKINVTINIDLKLVPATETTSDGKRKRINKLQTRVSCPGQPQVEAPVLNEMQRGCFPRINRFFRNRLGSIYHECIILDLSPDSVQSLHRLLEVIKSGELNHLILEILQKKDVLRQVDGTNLKVDVEIIVPEDVFRSSGLTLDDLKGLPVSGRESQLRDPEPENTSVPTASDHFTGQEIDLIIIGKLGNGKSSLGNIVTGTEAFLSKLSGFSVTQKCKTVSTMRNNYLLHVTDTPGGHGDETSSHLKLVVKELRKLMKLVKDHAIFILTCRIDRWKDDELALRFYKRLFGPHFESNAVVVFMGKDDLDHHGKSLEEYIKTSPSSLQDLVAAAGNRVFTVSKRASREEKDSFVEQLISTVVKMADESRGQLYTWDMMEQARAEEEQGIKVIQEAERERKIKKQRAMEETVRQGLQQEMQTQLDIQDKMLEMVHRSMEADTRHTAVRRGHPSTDEKHVQSETF